MIVWDTNPPDAGRVRNMILFYFREFPPMLVERTGRWTRINSLRRRRLREKNGELVHRRAPTRI
jgi:hypothetical protein